MEGTAECPVHPGCIWIVPSVERLFLHLVKQDSAECLVCVLLPAHFPALDFTHSSQYLGELRVEGAKLITRRDVLTRDTGGEKLT